MTTFPSWVSKTYWIKAGSAGRGNILDACESVIGMNAMGALRGIPVNPPWLKGTPVLKDIQFLRKRVTRLLKRERKEFAQREMMVKSCHHEYHVGRYGANKYACVKCGYTCG